MKRNLYNKNKIFITETTIRTIINIERNNEINSEIN